MTNLLSYWRRFAAQQCLIINISGNPALPAALTDANLPKTRLESVPGGGDVGKVTEILQRVGSRRVDLLCADRLESLTATTDLFFRNRVDAVLFSSDAAMVQFLVYH